MHILICNDDGILAPGLRDMADYLAQFYQVTVVAPEVEQSAKSHALTIETPLKIRKFSDDTANPRLMAVTGTPSDCMKLAMSYLLVDDMPDLVISGINHGFYLGSDVLYSGTVSGAMESMFYNIPGLALSVRKYSSRRGEEMLPFIKSFIEQIFVKEAFHGLLNVNFPLEGPCDWDHVEVVSQGFQRYTDIIDARMSRRGDEYFWIGGHLEFDKEDIPTDVERIEHGVITVVALTWKQQNDEDMEIVKKIVDKV